MWVFFLCKNAHTQGMENLYTAAKALQPQLVKWRRYLHGNAEVGFALEKTCAYVQEQLKSMGYAPKTWGKTGVYAELGDENSPVFLLRADMDGLPIGEKTGLPFACKTGQMHACGHDLHAAMLLGAAKLLKENEKNLKGRVRFLFQPAEETLEGAKKAVESKLLRDVKGAMTVHVITATDLPVESVIVSEDVGAPAADHFSIHVQGKGCHGSAPWNGVDALSIAARIVLALEELSAREFAPTHAAVLTFGAFVTQPAGNVISDKAELRGTLRCFDEDVREELKKRIREIALGVAKAFRAKARIICHSGCPVLRTDEGMSALAQKELKKCFGGGMYAMNALCGDVKTRNGGSEDFAYIASEVPAVTVAIAAGERNKGYTYPLHHPKVRFDEDALPVGAAAYASLAAAFFR